MVFKEYKGLDLPAISSEIMNFWEEHQIFEKSITERVGRPPYIFYEGGQYSRYYSPLYIIG